MQEVDAEKLQELQRENQKILDELFRKLSETMKPLEPEYAQVVSKRFWDLLA